MTLLSLRRVPILRRAISSFVRRRHDLDRRRAPRQLPLLRDELRSLKADYRLARFENDVLGKSIAWTRMLETKRRIARLERFL